MTCKLRLLLVVFCSCTAPTRPGVPPSTPSGSIVVVNTVALSGGSFNSLRAHFGLIEECTRTPLGESCTLIECAAREGFFDTAESASWGELTFTGFTFVDGSEDPMTTTLKLPYRAGSPRPTRMWSGGELIAVTTSSAGFPAFKLQVPAPDPFTVAQPSCSSSSCSIEVDRSKPLEVSWSAAGRGEPAVELGLSHYAAWPEGGRRLRLKRIAALQCRYPVDAVGATLSPELLGRLTPMADRMYEVGHLEVRRASSGYVELPEGTITLDAVWSALSEDVTIR